MLFDTILFIKPITSSKSPTVQDPQIKVL